MQINEILNMNIILLFIAEILLERKRAKKLGEENDIREFKAQVAMTPCSSPSHSLSNNDNIYANVSDVSSSSNSVKQQVSTSDSSHQTPLYLTNKTPRKLKLYNELQSKNKEIKDMKQQINAITQQLVQVNNVEQMLTLCKQFLPPSLFLIISTHVSRRNTKATGYKYCNEFKQLALTIYFLGPKV